MAGRREDAGRRKSNNQSESEDYVVEDVVEEPDFSDPEDFVDDVDDEGIDESSCLICFCATKFTYGTLSLPENSDQCKWKWYFNST